MIDLRHILLRSVAVNGTEAALDDCARFWTAVEWNAYLRRDNMLNTIIGGEPMEIVRGKTIKPDIADLPLTNDPSRYRIPTVARMRPE